MSNASILPLAPTAIHRLTSSQVISTLTTAVKELVENSLDASASSIQIRFIAHGTDSITVADDGTGVEQNDWNGLGQKYQTSKLVSWQQLTGDTDHACHPNGKQEEQARVQTFGFRGEALSSLCAVSDRVIITTATNQTAPIGTILPLTRTGTICVDSSSGGSKTARQRGTTVVVHDLFAPLPVRRKELLRNAKREYVKAIASLQAYALLSHGVRWNVIHHPGETGKEQETGKSKGRGGGSA